MAASDDVLRPASKARLALEAAVYQCIATAEKLDRVQVIAGLEEMRQTHVDWMDHFSNDGGKTEIACVKCPPNIRETVGDYDHHGACVEFYDAAIAMLREEGSERER